MLITWDPPPLLYTHSTTLLASIAAPVWCEFSLTGSERASTNPRCPKTSEANNVEKYTEKWIKLLCVAWSGLLPFYETKSWSPVTEYQTIMIGGQSVEASRELSHNPFTQIHESNWRFHCWCFLYQGPGRSDLDQSCSDILYFGYNVMCWQLNLWPWVRHLPLLAAGFFCFF